MRRLAVSLITIALLVSPAVGQEEQPPDGPERPSILVIVTDDQRWDTLWAMATVQARIRREGTIFANSFVVNSLCCPSRATLLTGNYSHTTGIWTNSGRHGGFSNFDASSTIATWLHDAGYLTGLFGKYLNGYDGVTIPPGWDRWVVFAQPQGSFYDYQVNEDGVIDHRGADPEDYSTDFFGQEAAEFILSAPPQRPLFLLYSVYAPHGPATPAPRHLGVFREIPPHRPPSFDERDVSDKPRWFQRRVQRMTPSKKRNVQSFRRKQLESLLAVDENVEGLLDALEATNRMSNTLIVFTSDNGAMLGEHRLRGKTFAYNESIRVPLVMRYDQVPQPAVVSRLVANIDIAPTIADVAGVTRPATDGRSLLPLLSGEATSWRNKVLVEHVRHPDGGGDGGGQGLVPTYCAVRTISRLYVKYAPGAQEFYNLARDPYELDNRAKRKSAKPAVKRLRRAARRLCQPLPPGMPHF